MDTQGRMRFASRFVWTPEVNPLMRRLEEMRRRGAPVLDLTETNPTRAALDYDDAEILAAISRRESLRYEPSPRGLRAAREAVCAYYRDHSQEVDPEAVVLTSGTSEAYADVFKLVGDPGDEVLLPRPSYPLFEYLAVLEGLHPQSYPLRYDEESGWRLDRDALLDRIGRRARAVVAVHPNNPTGSYLDEDELLWLAELCAQRGMALVVDEVFRDYRNPGCERVVAGAVSLDRCLTFVLSGLSKVAGLPQLKLGWIVVTGPAGLRDEALERLDVIADTYLCTGTPVQHALPVLLAGRHRIQGQIQERLARNEKTLIAAYRSLPGLNTRIREGGWYAVLEVPAHPSDEEIAGRLLEERRVLVHPGYLYDFEEEGILVASLLAPPEIFAQGVAELVSCLAIVAGDA